MSITTKIQNAKIEYADKYIDEPELLFISPKVYEELFSPPNTKDGIEFQFGSVEMIIVEGFDHEFMFLSDEDVNNAIRSKDETDNNHISINKRMKTSGKILHEYGESINPAVFQNKPLIIPKKVLQAYKRYIDSKHLQF